MIPSLEDGRVCDNSCIGSQRVFWSILSGFSLPKESLISLTRGSDSAYYTSTLSFGGTSAQPFSDGLSKGQNYASSSSSHSLWSIALDFALPLETKLF